MVDDCSHMEMVSNHYGIRYKIGPLLTIILFASHRLQRQNIPFDKSEKSIQWA